MSRAVVSFSLSLSLFLFSHTHTIFVVAPLAGAAIVTFEAVASAQACGEVMHGRSFSADFIEVQALGNWGQGPIVPEAGPMAGGGSGGGGGGGADEVVPDSLDDFFSAVDQMPGAPPRALPPTEDVP